MNGLDLFSGIGGNTLGLRGYIETIAYCEQDRHAQSVLLSRMGDGSIGPAPIWDDITTLTSKHFDVPIDIIVGGFPCQDISVAGNGAGLEGKRSGLFFEVCRLVKEIQPAFVFLENVPAIRTRGLWTVVNEFTDLGYDCRWTCVSAAEVGAPHLRKRWFLLANAKGPNDRGAIRTIPSKGEAFPRPENKHQNSTKQPRNSSTNPTILANTYNSGLERRAEARDAESQGQGAEQYSERHAYLSREYWAAEPDLDRVANGIPLRVDRIKRIGNGVVPLQVKTAFERLMGI